jgi:hypothetical protein
VADTTRNQNPTMLWLSKSVTPLYPFLGDHHEEEDIRVRDDRTAASNHQLGRRQRKG